MNVARIWIFGVMVFGLGSSGCAALQDLLGFGYTKPEISLRSIDVKNVSLSSIDMRVRLRVKNPNSFALKMDKLDYKVEALGMDLANGRYHKSFEVKAEGQGDIELPLEVNPQMAFKLLKVIMDEPQVDHVALVTATVVFDSPIGKIEQTFEDEQSLANLSK